MAKVQRLEVRCDHCCSPLRLRTAQSAFRAFAAAMQAGDLEPEDIVFTTMCSRRTPGGQLCNTLIEVRAKHLRPVSN